MTASKTTAALHTPPGRGGIAVISLTGPRAGQILEGAFRPSGAHRGAGADALQLGYLVAGGGQAAEAIDQAVVCRTPEGVEINIHGGPHVARRTLEVLAGLGAEPRADDDAPPALPTRHARWNNPAVGAELLAAMPRCHSELAAAALGSQWSAGLSELASQPAPEAAKLRRAAGDLAVMHRLLEPPEVVLAGPPNAGKSALANALIGREVSIVHDRAGTTRDWVRELAIIRGVPIRVTDTAGLWEAPEGIDAQAVRRARRRAEAADLVLLLGEGQCPSAPEWLHPGRLLRVVSKCDLRAFSRGDSSDRGAGLTVSALTGEGLDDLKDAIVEAMGLAGLDPAAPMAFTRRQADLLTRAADALDAGKAGEFQYTIDSLLRG